MFKCSSSYKYCVYCDKAQKAGAFSHPLYVAVCFISYIIILAHFSINDIFWKAAEDSRNLEKCLADASVSKSVKYMRLLLRW